MRALAAALVLLAASASAAHADTAAEQAAKLFDEGRALIEAHDDQGACEKFEEAAKLDPGALGTLLNLGLCYGHLGKTASSLRWYRRAVDAAVENKDTDSEAAARAKTVELAARVPTYRIDVGAAPAGVSIRVDGEELDPGLYARIELDPGHHVFDARARGYVPQHWEDDAAENQHDRSHVLDPFRAPRLVDRGASRRRVAYIVGGVGVVALAGSLGLNLYERGKNNDARAKLRDPMADHTMDATYASDAEHAKKVARYGGSALFAAGLAGVGAGVVLWLTAPGTERAEPVARWSPLVGPDQLGLAFGGVF